MASQQSFLLQGGRWPAGIHADYADRLPDYPCQPDRLHRRRPHQGTGEHFLRQDRSPGQGTGSGWFHGRGCDRDVERQGEQERLMEGCRGAALF